MFGYNFGLLWIYDSVPDVLYREICGRAHHTIHVCTGILHECLCVFAAQPN